MKIDKKRVRERIARESLVLGRGLGAAFGAMGLSQFFVYHQVATGLYFWAIAAYAYILGVAISIVLDCLDDTDET